MERLFNKYSLIILIVMSFLNKASYSQCTYPGGAQPAAAQVSGSGGSASGCPATYSSWSNFAHAWVQINGAAYCKNFINNLVYWPKNQTLNWGMGQESGGNLCVCENYGYYQSGPQSYGARANPLPFNVSIPGLYKVGFHVIMRLEKWGNQCYKKIGAKKYEYDLSVYICVIDIPKGTISVASNCGSSITLTRPEPPSGYSYYWQSTSTGVSLSYPGPSFSTSVGGRYYLRAKHNVSGIWGEASFVDVNLLPALAPPPTPVVNGNICGNITLSYGSTPPEGVNYYWQGLSCGVDKTSAAATASTYIATVSGQPYYIRAFNGSCWSECTSVTPTVNNVPPAVSSDVFACSCGTDPIIVTATPGPFANTCRWYNSSNTLLFEGNSYTAPVTSNTTIYVTSYNTSNGCESVKIPVAIKFKSCGKCLDAFAPIEGKKYVISAWVKESNGFEATTYNNGYITLFYEGVNSSSTKFKGSGEIVEGWQKIEREFTIPTGATGIKVQLNNGGTTADVFFDDIRLYPFDGNMVTYVYDPVTLKLSAELDANNYATYYNYDDEGKLTKLKKETVGGIKTIKEGRSANVIKQ